MSLRDEIEKIIQSEREKLESRDRGHLEFRERQRERFRPLRALLHELAASIDTAHLKAAIREDDATIEVGTRKDDNAHFETDVRWRIEPNRDLRLRAERCESLFVEASGFRVEETVYYRFPEYESFEETHKFDTEEDVINYLVDKIAEKVAFYRHLDMKKS